MCFKFKFSGFENLQRSMELCLENQGSQMVALKQPAQDWQEESQLILLSRKVGARNDEIPWEIIVLSSFHSYSCLLISTDSSASQLKNHMLDLANTLAILSETQQVPQVIISKVASFHQKITGSLWIFVILALVSGKHNLWWLCWDICWVCITWGWTRKMIM